MYETSEDPDANWQIEPTTPTECGDPALAADAAQSGPDTAEIGMAEGRSGDADIDGDSWREGLSVPPPNRVELPGNIQELLDSAITDETIDAGATDKQIIPERPDLLVRLNIGTPLAERQVAKAAGDRLLNHGVNVLPSSLVEHGGAVKAVTKMVDGIVLDEILTPDLPDWVVAQVDTTWAGLTKGLAECMEHGAPFPVDVTTSHQAMYGPMAGEEDPKVWMVDLPVHVTDVTRPDVYEKEVLDLANQVVAIEIQTGKELPEARAALAAALRLNRESEAYGDGLTNSARFVLENRELLGSWQERRILSMRTGYVPPEAPEFPSFEPYAEQLQDIADQIDSGVDPAQIPDYIDTRVVGQTVLGSRKYVMSTYQYETADGHVLRVPRADLTDLDGRFLGRRQLTATELAEEVVGPLLNAAGAEHLQQMITYTDAQGGATVCERAWGAEIQELLPHEINRIPARHFEGLMEACRELSVRQLHGDFESLVYDRNLGFSLPEYRLREVPTPLEANYQAEGYGITIIWQIQQREATYPPPLPPAGETFYHSFRKVFGDEAAWQWLERLRWSEIVIPEELLAG